MSDEPVVRLLTEIRDLMREQAARQEAALAEQRAAGDAYGRLLRRSWPGIMAAIALVLLALLLLLFLMWRRLA